MNIRKINEYFSGKIKCKDLKSPMTKNPEETRRLTELIHELNREGMPGFSLQILKQKVQNEYVLMEKEGDDQELSVERFH